MPSRLIRPVKGKFFSEGSRQLWLALDEKRWSQEELAAKLGTKSGHTSPWLYGTRRPGLEWALRIEKVLGIEASAWLDTSSRLVVRFAIPGRQTKAA